MVSSVRLDTSCEAPLFLGDRFGAFELVAADTMSLGNRSAGTDDVGTDDTESADRRASTGEASWWETIPWMVLGPILAVVLIGSVACYVYALPSPARREAGPAPAEYSDDQLTKLKQTLSGRPLPSEPGGSSAAYDTITVKYATDDKYESDS